MLSALAGFGGMREAAQHLERWYYLLKEPEKKRPIVLIVPGGGYTMLCIEADGEKTAMQYNAAGFHAAVLSYSVEPHHFPEPQRDLMSAIRILRENGDISKGRSRSTMV